MFTLSKFSESESSESLSSSELVVSSPECGGENAPSLSNIL